MHRVAGLCLDWVVPFDLTSVTQVLASARGRGGRPLYEFLACSPDGAPVRTDSGFSIAP